MDLREYLFRNHMNVTEFSKILDCNRSYLSEIIHGSKRPGKRLAKDIEKATNGEVTVKELLGTKGE